MAKTAIATDDPTPGLIRVRFRHVNDKFRGGVRNWSGDVVATLLQSKGDGNYDAEMLSVPNVGDRVEFPPTFYRMPCVVVERHHVLHDDIPANVVILVEDAVAQP